MFKRLIRMTIHTLKACLPTYLGLILLGLPAQSAGASLSMEYELGFDGHFELHRWTPLTVVLTNRGAAARGTLEVVVTSGSEYFQNVRRTVHAMDVEIPHNSKKLCAFTVNLQSVAHALVIRYRSAERIFLSAEVNLRTRYSKKSLIAVLDAAITPDFLAALPQAFLAVRARVRHLPEAWYGYEGVRMLILNPDRLNRLRDRQYLALARWLQHGGLVLTYGGANYGSLLQERPQQLLSINVRGHRQFIEIEALKAFCGSKLTAAMPFLVLHADVGGAETIVAQGEIPIVVQKRIANGRIFFLALDPRRPPFNRWQQRSRFWDRILSLSSDAVGPAPALDATRLVASISATPRLNFPNFKLAALFLVVYGLTQGLMIRRFSRLATQRRTNVRGLLAVIILGSLLSYGFSYRSPSDRRLVYNGFMQMDVDGRNAAAVGNYTLGLYSLGGMDYELSFGDTAFPILPLAAPSEGSLAASDHVLVETPSGQIARGRLPNWSWRFFNLQPRFDFALTGTAVMRSQVLEISIDNASPHNILDGLICHDGRFFSLGDIAPQHRRTLRIPLQALSDPNTMEPQAIDRLVKGLAPGGGKSLLTRVQTELAGDWLRAVQADSGYGRQIVQLIGWVRSGLIEPGFKSGPVQGEAAAVIRCRIPLETDDDAV
jgi:hypothetical protein